MGLRKKMLEIVEKVELLNDIQENPAMDPKLLAQIKHEVLTTKPRPFCISSINSEKIAYVPKVEIEDPDQAKLQKIEQKIETLIDRLIDTKSDRMIKNYEKRIEKLENTKLKLENKIKDNKKAEKSKKRREKSKGLIKPKF